MPMMVQKQAEGLGVVLPNGRMMRYPAGKHPIPEGLVGYVMSVGGMAHAWRRATIQDAEPGDEVLVVRDMGLGDVLLLRPSLAVLAGRRELQVRVATLERYECLLWDLNVSLRTLGSSGGSAPARGREIVWDLRYAVERAGYIHESDRIDVFAWLGGMKLREDEAALPLSLPAQAMAAGDVWLADRDLNAPVGVVAEASTGQRTWPHWRQLCAELTARGIDNIVLGHRSHPDVQTNAQTAGLPLMQAIAIIKRCALVVTPDTGLLHAAAAVGTPTLALFGSWPARLRMSHYPNCYALEGTAGCAPCYDRAGCGVPACLDGISVGRVLAELGVMADAA